LAHGTASNKQATVLENSIAMTSPVFSLDIWQQVKMQCIDLTLGIVKTSHHVDFDEAWYFQPHPPPAAQLLYDLGLEYEDNNNADELQEQTASPSDLKALWPPCLPLPLLKGTWNPPTESYTALLPLWELAMPRPITARAT
jgi:hypothetical protein